MKAGVESPFLDRSADINEQLFDSNPGEKPLAHVL